MPTMFIGVSNSLNPARYACGLGPSRSSSTNYQRRTRIQSLIFFIVTLAAVSAVAVEIRPSPPTIAELPPLPPGASPSDVQSKPVPPLVPSKLQPGEQVAPTLGVSRKSPIPTQNNVVQAPSSNLPSQNIGRVLGSTPPFVWDGDFKNVTSQPGEPNIQISFAFTNIANYPVTIRAVRPSCGCTLAEIPPVPWLISPGSNGVIKSTVDLRGKRQMLSKSITVETSHGFKIISFRVNIPDVTNLPSAAGQDRNRNMSIAKADRQAVFRGDCASCHVEPTVGKMGKELYETACGICHDAEHRAGFVPDLKNRNIAVGEAYWRHWITLGKSDSLMPAFGSDLGGPLTPIQISSLVDYLAHDFRAESQKKPVTGLTEEGSLLQRPIP